MTASLPYGSTMKSSHVATLQLPIITLKSRKIHISPKMRTSPLISLTVLCDDGCTSKLEKKGQFKRMYKKQ